MRRPGALDLRAIEVDRGYAEVHQALHRAAAHADLHHLILRGELQQEVDLSAHRRTLERLPGEKLDQVIILVILGVDVALVLHAQAFIQLVADRHEQDRFAQRLG
jgi:hypothetical protein